MGGAPGRRRGGDLRCRAGGGPIVPDTLTISVDLRTLERPSQVAERLPKALIHHNVAGQGIHDLLVALDRAWDRAAPQGVFGPRQRWLASLAMLRADGVPLQDGPHQVATGRGHGPVVAGRPALTSRAARSS